jgi:hypothetical protein
MFSVLPPFSTHLRNKNIDTDSANRNLKFLKESSIDKRKKPGSVFQSTFSVTRLRCYHIALPHNCKAAEQHTPSGANNIPPMGPGKSH